MNKTLSLAAAVLASAFALTASAQQAGPEITQITLINVLPTALASKVRVDALFADLVAATSKQPGLVQVRVTRQVGQPYNFTLIERWKDQASLDAASASPATQKFEQAIAPLLSGPSYQRTFKAFE